MKAKQDATSAILKKIARQGVKVEFPHIAGVDNCRFVESYYRTAHPEDLSAPPMELAAAALSHLSWAATRQSGRVKVRVFNPVDSQIGWKSPNTIVQFVTDDSPFIIDSVTMRLNASGHGILSSMHPILRVARNKQGKISGIQGDKHTSGLRSESWVHIEIPRIFDKAELGRLKSDIESTLSDVGLAVKDWRKMLAKLNEAAAELQAHARAPIKLKYEMCAFVEWLVQDHFTLLGYCEYRNRGKALKPVATSGLGILRETRGQQDYPSNNASLQKTRTHGLELSVTKAPIRSTIHRPVPLDDVSICLFDAGGRKQVEYRFLGLFTSGAYIESPGNIPMLRMKINAIVAKSGLDPVGHKGRALRHILDTLPRDELIQASIEQIRTTATGVLALADRRRVKLFLRLDGRGNFYSCLVYLPRDQFSAATRKRVEFLLADKLGGPIVDSQLTVSEAALARLAITVAVEDRPRDKIDIGKLNDAITEAATTWPERVRAELLLIHDESHALSLHAQFSELFPLGYQDVVTPRRATRDISILSKLASGEARLETVLEGTSDPHILSVSVFSVGAPVPLYLANPILENMGLRVVRESNFSLSSPKGDLWIQDFELQSAAPIDISSGGLTTRFQQCFIETLLDRIDNDGFNQLVVSANLDWRQANLLRAYCKYILQGTLRFSQAYMLDTLTRYPKLTRALVELFSAYFDPDLPKPKRESLRAECQQTIQRELETAVSLDDDRILRAFASVVQATLRTNYYQVADDQPKSYVSFKLDSSKIPDLPRPRPMFEIFVYSRRVEGVHLRCGKVARGGLRWSDRREDFRTEVLGLMKAQQVKNTVIVPTGAKGGFVCKRLPAGDRSAIQAEVIDCYKTFLSGLLDITDNIVDEKAVTPDRVLRRDSVDTYLVVAADKGTATFSDIANALSAEYGFWLGDAFASGGSAGYDHKVMAITARGAWESVKRHFRELGLDIQDQEFTVVGIGDMAGDVFGNGMLLSENIKLVAAFNHQNIFIDPRPNSAASFAERRRLFALPRSSWEDYDRALLSEGGGIYRRDAKSIELSKHAQQALGIQQDKIAPPDLIRSILTAPVDLLWNGGIGTYVKSAAESHLDAGDPVNDVVRINGSDLRCRVVAEGGNLGLTQLGRVEFSLAGGKINTDFIDNSGGVDSSDREVNIKILLRDAIARGELAAGKRNALLAKMTDTVAGRVMASNYAQGQALSVMASHATERIGEHGRLMRILEAKGLLDRGIEFLPSDEQINDRRKEGAGLTRPELAVILSYAKIDLFESLVATDIPGEPHYADELTAYFPPLLSTKFRGLISGHRLAREIVAMLIASSMINRMGPFFALRAQEDTGADTAQVARAYATIRSLFGTRQLWVDIEALDGQVQAQVQYDIFYRASRMIRRAVYWVLHRHPQHMDVTAIVGEMTGGIGQLAQELPIIVCGIAKRRFESDAREHEGLGVPLRTSRKIAALRFMPQMLDIVELATKFGSDAATIGRLYFELGRGLHTDWLREEIEELEVDGHWRALARGALRETLGREQQRLLANVLSRAGKDDPRAALTEWLTEVNGQIVRMKHTFEEMRLGGPMDFATLSIALKEVSRLN
jgi:glutamate dehydrogenase